MKCKTGFKKVKGKCKKVSKVKTQKQKNLQNRWVTIVLFFSFSLIVFINDVTDLFVKFGIEMPVYYVGWAGMILTMFYTWWSASQGKL